MTGTGPLEEDAGISWEGGREHFIRGGKMSGMHFRKKVSVGILGATSCVGQRLLSLLGNHPWFELTCITSSEAVCGKRYRDVVNWKLPTAIPQPFYDMPLFSSSALDLPCQLLFSVLDEDQAADIEKMHAEQGRVVITHTPQHRMNREVPLCIPEVNSGHIALAKTQNFSSGGMVIAYPDSAVVGLSLLLCPLHLEFGIESVHAVMLQPSPSENFAEAVSASVLDNVIPCAEGAEEKIVRETKKVFGNCGADHIDDHPMKITSSVNHVALTEGHVGIVSFMLQTKVQPQQILSAWKEFQPASQEMGLPSSPKELLCYFDNEYYPQPKIHRDLHRGMCVSIGRLQPSATLDYTCVMVSNNMMRGSAGGMVLLAEYLVKNGHVFW